jgi:hypothetical protein
MKTLILPSLVFFLIGNYLFIQACDCQYRAVHIPNEKLLSMDIDGDINDWSWVPSEYILTDSTLERSNKIMKPNDYDVKLIIAWNSLKNWLYFVIEIKDNFFAENTDKSIKGDNFKIKIDPLNHRKEFSGSKFITACTALPTNSNEQDEFQFDLRGTEWMKKPLYSKVAKKVKKDTGSTLITYEMGMALWDEWSEPGEFNSRIHQLKPNENISLFVLFEDIDEKGRTTNYLNTKGLYPGYQWWVTSNAFSLIHLDWK